MTFTKPINILLADDHQIFREGLKALLEEAEMLNVLVQASNGVQVLKQLENHKVDIVMMDIHMPVMTGIECMQEIKKKHPELPVLALTMAADEIYIKRMLKAGANGYLLKNSGGKELLKAIEAVLMGQQYYSEKVGQIIMDSLAGKQKPKAANTPAKVLTPREIEILKLIATEHSNGEIAEQLFISVRTVDAHKRNILQKIGAKNTAGMTRYAFKYFKLD